MQLIGSGNAFYIAEMLYYSSSGLGLESDSSPVFGDLDLRPLDLWTWTCDFEWTHPDLNLDVIYLNENTLIFH